MSTEAVVNILRKLAFPETIQATTRHLLVWTNVAFAIVYFHGATPQGVWNILMNGAGLIAIYYLMYLARLTIKTKKDSVRMVSQITHNNSRGDYTSIRYDALAISDSTVPKGLVKTIIVSLIVFFSFIALMLVYSDDQGQSSDNGVVQGLVTAAVVVTLIIVFISAARSSSRERSQSSGGVKGFAADNQFIVENHPISSLGHVCERVLISTAGSSHSRRVETAIAGSYRGRNFLLMLVKGERPVGLLTSIGRRRRIRSPFYGVAAVPLPSGVDLSQVTLAIDQVRDEYSVRVTVGDGMVFMEFADGLPQDRAGMVGIFKRIDAVYDLR